MRRAVRDRPFSLLEPGNHECHSCRHTLCVLKTGPDGYQTLCHSCYKKHTALQLPLFLRPDGKVTALPRGRPVVATGFRKLQGKWGRDLSRPYVRDSSKSEHADLLSLKNVSLVPNALDVEKDPKPSPSPFQLRRAVRKHRQDGSPRSITQFDMPSPVQNTSRYKAQELNKKHPIVRGQAVEHDRHARSSRRSTTPDRLKQGRFEEETSSELQRQLRRKRVLEVLSVEAEEPALQRTSRCTGPTDKVYQTEAPVQTAKRARLNETVLTLAKVHEKATSKGNEDARKVNQDTAAVHKQRSERPVRASRIIETDDAKSFAVEMRCCYGWSIQRRCMFVAYSIKFKLFKELVKGAFELDVDFEIRYLDDDGDEVSVSSDIEMQPLFAVARKLKKPLSISLYPPQL